MSVSEEEWLAIEQNDKSFDGVFYYGLRTTKNVCRPSCPARTCKRENVIIFYSLKEALDSGFTPCKRCCPEKEGWDGPKAELAMAAKNYIEEHYNDKFSLERIASDLFSNGSYLLRTFKQITGYTLLDYHNRVRCEKAADLLSATNYKLAFISDTVGYNSSSHFTRVFEKIYRMSPSEYRKKYGRNTAEDTIC